jgi:hypothetical protein
MAKYLVLIYGNAQTWADAPEEWHRQNADKHTAFHAEAGAAVVGGLELEPIGAAISVRAGKDGRPAVTNGPFLETKEVIGGYYVLEAAGETEAIRLAGLIPEATAPEGGVEIRRVAVS